MKKNFSVFCCLLITASLSFMACDHDEENDPPPCGYNGGYATLYVTNNTSSTIFDEFYITPSSSTSWGTDYISDYLNPGYYYEISDIPAGNYDFMIGAGGSYLESYNNCLEGGYWYNWTLTDLSGSYRDAETVLDAILEADRVPDEVMFDDVKYQQ